MKIRTGFVSNSSSTSFVVIFPEGFDAATLSSDKNVKNLLKESRIRGLHAFGVALRLGKSEFIPHKFFHLQEALDYIDASIFDTAILHTRYDTSGDWRILDNNQPVYSHGSILVFNGVIRMSTQKQYEVEFGRSYLTDNDGEIILDMYIRQEHDKVASLLSEECVSFAGIFAVNGEVFAIRNERRPMWYAENGREKVIVSTKDILLRASPEAFPVSREVIPMEVLAPC